MSFKDTVKTGLAHLLAKTVPPGLLLDRRFFELWQSRGYHITPVHYYALVPDTRTLSDRLFETPSEMVGVDLREPEQLVLLKEFASRYRAEYIEPPMTEATPDWGILYAMVRYFQPRRIIEIGSGISTQVMAKALVRNQAEGGPAGKLLAIEPYPNETLKQGFAGLTELRPVKVQDVPTSEFQQLEAKDILFIDSSHVAAIGSDVVYELNEILPRLRPGVIVHIHDIYLPFEYPPYWAMQKRVFWNEAYLLHAFLTLNPSFEVLWSGYNNLKKHPEELEAAFGKPRDQLAPSSFWIRRTQ